jgi:hypothetical protein
MSSRSRATLLTQKNRDETTKLKENQVRARENRALDDRVGPSGRVLVNQVLPLSYSITKRLLFV